MTVNFPRFILLALALTACTPAPVTAPDLIAPTRLAAKATTGTGGTYDARLIGSQLEVSYDDRYRYFQGALELGAYVKLHLRNGEARDLGLVALHQPTGGTSVRSGRVGLPVDGGEVVVVELAFCHGDRWDSDNGKNYRVSF
jgi:hypothetical protein